MKRAAEEGRGEESQAVMCYANGGWVRRVLGTNIPQYPAAALATPLPAKKDRAKLARKDAVAVSAVSKEINKEPRNSTDLIRELKDQRAASNSRTASFALPPSSVDPLSHVRQEPYYCHVSTVYRCSYYYLPLSLLSLWCCCSYSYSDFATATALLQFHSY